MRPSFTNEKVLTIYKEMRMFLESLHDMAHSSTAKRKINRGFLSQNFSMDFPGLGQLGSKENVHDFLKSTIHTRVFSDIFGQNNQKNKMVGMTDFPPLFAFSSY